MVVVATAPQHQLVVFHSQKVGPVVGRDVVAFVEDDLGRHVLRGPAERPGFPSNLKLELLDDRHEATE